MNTSPTPAWICPVCGYIYYGAEPPEECPICGTPKAQFEPYTETVPTQAEPAASTAAPQGKKIVICGAGIAGVAAAEAARKADPQAEIVLISNEADWPYYRMNLTRYLAGEVTATDLVLHPQGWYAEHGITLRRETSLSALDLPHKELALNHGGSRISFDKLVLAAGSHPFVPPFPGAGLANVTTLRTRQDADFILTACQDCPAVVVIGGGLLGLEQYVTNRWPYCLNAGVLVGNFAGHGNPVQLSNDDVFDIPTSVPKLVNADRLTVFFLATCNFSEFDDPLSRTGSEVLINKPDGGAIGVASANRKVFAGENAALNQGTYQAMFTRDAYGRVVVDRPAQAPCLPIRRCSGTVDNDQKYSYMGDPTMRLQFPRGYASFDSLNGRALDSAGSRFPPSLSSVRSPASRSQGRSVTRRTRFDAAYNGRVQVTLNDATRIQTIVDFYPGEKLELRGDRGSPVPR